jgi:putative colanic acid biosynthesis acetyltransferase WcaF
MFNSDADLTERDIGAKARVRSAAPPSKGDKVRRLIWLLVESTIYRWSPTPLHRWRCFLLRAFGAEIGDGAHPYPTAKIWAPWHLRMGPRSCLGPGVKCYSAATITLGAGTIVSQGAYLCSASHDHRDAAFPLVLGAIEICEGAWVAAEAFIGPGVRIGPRSVVAARAVVIRDVGDEAVVAGNPAQLVGLRDKPAK